MPSILQQDGSGVPGIWEAFCGRCTAVELKTIVHFDTEKNARKTEIKRCPAGFDLTRESCIKHAQWRTLLEAIKEAQNK